MPSAEECPISQMVFAGSNPDALVFDNQKLGNNIAVYYTRSSTSHPIIETILDENDPCYNPDFVPITANRRPYPLMNKVEEPGCKSDSRWTKHEYLSYGRKSTYDLHQIPYTILPAFVINDEQKLTRYHRKLIEWNPKCKEIVETFIQQVDALKRVDTLTLLSHIFAWISFSICIAFNLIEWLIILTNKGRLIRLYFYIPKMLLYTI